MKIISCNGNLELSKSVAKYLNTDLCKAEIKKFSDQEVWVEILENVRGEDCFIIQPTSFPTNDNLMELLVTIDACRRGSAKQITAVIPYYGYARQDRKSGPRTPITAKLVARMLETAGVDRVLTIDLHANQIQGFFEVPTDNLFAIPILIKDIKSNLDTSLPLCLVSPDIGGVARARAFAKHLNADLAIIDKRRPKANVSEVMNVIGDVKGKQCILVDDMADSAGTLCGAAKALIENGAVSVSAYVSHGVFSGPAMERINDSVLKEVVSTDSIEMTEKARNNKKIRHVSIAPLLAEAMTRIKENRSISELFNVK
ncbi:MAG: ribose-phosphate pyrophosphokinase [Alphaproteobacteria bacterium]